MGAPGTPQGKPVLTPARRRSLAEDVAEQVREAILQGQLAPGQHLREEELAGRLQVSRGPVREALALLEREGLVRVARHRGASVVALSGTDLEELYGLRAGLDAVAAQLAARRARPEDLDAAAAILDRFAAALDGSLTGPEAARLDLAFHDQVYRAGGNGRLLASWMNIRAQVHLFLLSNAAGRAGWREALLAGYAGHTGILDAVRAGDEQAAARRAVEHVAAASGRLLPGLAVAPLVVPLVVPAVPPAGRADADGSPRP